VAAELQSYTGLTVATTSELVQNNDTVSSPLIVSEKLMTPKAINELREKVREYDELVARLHAAEAHPDYEYRDTLVLHGSQRNPPPKGKGWELNTDHPENGEVGPEADTYYWRRLKEDALEDDINPYELPPVILEPINRDELFRIFIEKSTTMTKEPRGMLPSSILGIYDEHSVKSGYYRADTTDGDMMLFMVMSNLEILMNLTQQCAEIRVRRKGCSWYTWLDAINVNTMELREAFDLYG
jgi:hypothetical protein